MRANNEGYVHWALGALLAVAVGGTLFIVRRYIVPLYRLYLYGILIDSRVVPFIALTAILFATVAGTLVMLSFAVAVYLFLPGAYARAEFIGLLALTHILGVGSLILSLELWWRRLMGTLPEPPHPTAGNGEGENDA